ncbi:MAG: RNA polymerase sigma factor [Agathobacter sp.]|nr:RNA polymerase sigma factor [Agathobacter sp.]
MTPFRSKEQEFETAYELYADMLYRLALSYMKQKEDAEDIVQEVFTKYFCGFHLPLSGEQEKAWFIRVTINQCHDALRKRSYRLHDSVEDVAEVAGGTVDEPDELFDVLQKLPDKYKDVIILHYLEGYSVEEVAKMLGLSASATKMRLKRGREFLKDELERK